MLYSRTTCVNIGDYKGNLGADISCMDKCLVYPADNCSEDECYCYEE